jgi:pyruvate dehydrogenase E2 component (dihydrolipoamide acetyltransferase)
MALTKVVMPKLSEAMETGKLIKWLKKEGDRVQGGDIIAEIETDKADVEMEAFGGGVLRKVLLQPGDRAPVGALIAVIAEPDDDISALLAGAAGASGEPAPVAAAGAPSPPRATVPADATPPARPALVSAAPREPSAVPPSPPAAAPPDAGDTERVRVSPLARRIAAQAGVDLRLIQGSGPGGRIVRRDVEAALGRARPAEAAPAAAAPRPALGRVAEGPEYEDVALTSIRAAIARRMVLSKAPVPHFYVTSEVAMDRAWELRDQLNQLEGEPRISVNDLVVRACAIALGAHPGVNASLQGDAVRLHRRAHIGIAVALDEGLITPVLRDCDGKSLAQIAIEGRDLVERARARKLRANELSGATFSISNLGMFDVVDFSAIINPPEGAILAVGAVRQVPVATPAGVGIGRRMHVTLSCDHRVMDGAMGARFLRSIKRLLEEPLRLLI